MKIYVITSGDYSDYHIDQIFLDERKAEDYVKYHQKDHWEKLRIETWRNADDLYDIGTEKYMKCEATVEVWIDYDNRNKIKFYPPEISCDYVIGTTEGKGFSHPKDSRLIKFVKYFREGTYDLEEAKKVVQKIMYDTLTTLKDMVETDGASLHDILSLFENEAYLKYLGIEDKM